MEVAEPVAAVHLIRHSDQPGPLRRARARAADHIPTGVIDVGAVAGVGDVNQHASPAARLERDVGHPAHRVDGGAPGGQVVLEGWLAEDVAEAASRSDSADFPNPWMGMAVYWGGGAFHRPAGGRIGGTVSDAAPRDK